MDEFPGFGSPVASQGGFLNVKTPETKMRGPGNQGYLTGSQDNMQSPLLFRRTPGVNGTPCADSGKRFSDWVMSTSPYAGQKTPPTVSMASVKAGDENTPPPAHDMNDKPGPSGSSQHFQAWLKATSNTKWTPKRSPGAATPPPAPAPSPAGTPMSTSQLPSSAVSPAAAEPRSRPLFDLGASPDSDSEDDEATTTVGAQEVVAAAARMRAALVSAGAGGAAYANGTAHGVTPSSTTPRAPAPTPASCSPAAAAVGAAAAHLDLMQHQQEQQVTVDSLATPMSQLSMSRCAPGSASRDSVMRGGSFSQQKRTPSAAWPHLTPSRSQQAPASPMEKVIGLMLEPTAAGHSHNHGPSRLAGRAAQGHHDSQPPPSPEQQVIQLMLQQQDAGAATAEEDAAAASGPQLQQGGAIGEDEQYFSDYDDSGYGSSDESGDEIDVEELHCLCGAAAAPGTPISDIINMMLTPELKATPSFTPKGALGAEQPGEGVGPRVLFADD